MSLLNTLAYRLKHGFPRLFAKVEQRARGITALRYSRRLTGVREASGLEGTVHDRDAVIRPLGPEDQSALRDLLHRLPEDQLQFFRPHGFDTESLTTVLTSSAFLPSGLFIQEELVAYALLKITPTGSIFAGSMVRPEWQGQGIGTFLSRYMYWQAALAGLPCHATISKGNLPSLKAYQSGRDYRVLSELPNEYLLLEFPPMPIDEETPRLEIVLQ
ncbi:MAG: GNAT family N-acetyltransferase [Pseudomonadota bacterium]